MIDNKLVRNNLWSIGLIGLLFLALSASTLKAAVKLPAIIGDNMVLQRDMKVPIWGWADAGEKISVEFQGKVYQTVTASNGAWSLKLGSYKAGGPFEMLIKGQKDQIALKNILIGEVWMATGQSNMEFGIQTEKGSQEAIAGATDKNIHFFYAPMAFSLVPQQDIKAVNSKTSLNGKWIVCSPEAMATPSWAWHGFSAIGYHFATQIRKIAGCPVGMIASYKGGTPAQAWVSLEGLKQDPAFSKYVEKHQALADKKDEGGFGAPTNLYNAMINPLVPYGIKGVIWYQGEGNGDRIEDAMEYKTLFPALIKDWRKNWNQGNFPFLFVQLPNFKKPATTSSEGIWPWVREAQLKTLSLPNTGMAVITDLGEADNIHPTNKIDVGLRLALVASHVAYGNKLVYSGPIFRSMKVEGNKIRLSFDQLGSGLTVGNSDLSAGSSAPAELKGFGISGKDKKFVWAKAVIDGNSVVVSADEIKEPVAVRFNWANNPPGNLYNKEKLLASPFRTDNWDLVR